MFQRGRRASGPSAAVDTAFDAFYRAGLHTMVALATSLTGDAGHGAELAQEALLRTYRSWETVSSLDRPGAWTRRVLINLTIDARRHCQRAVLVGRSSPARPTAPRRRGSYAWTLPDTLPRSKVSPDIVDRALPTNYIMGRYAGPKAGTKDYYALRITAAVLSGQLFGEIRSRRNLAYAVDAPFVDRAVAAGGFYVTTVQPEVTVDLMRQQLAGLRTGTIDEGALARLVHQFLTQFYLDNESNADQADFLAKSYLFDGDIRAVERFEQQLRSVTPQDIQRVAQRYMREVRWTYIGDAKKAPLRSFDRY